MKIEGCHEEISRGSFEITPRHVREEAGQRPSFRHWLEYVRRRTPTAKDFSISMRDAFSMAGMQVPSIVVQRGLVGGNPCIKGTRIPVYMILDAIEYHGSLKGVLKSYPQLTIEQVTDAVRFAKIAIDCCLEH